MTTATEHGETILAAIVPDRIDLLEFAMVHLHADHFLDRTQRNIYLMLERYVEVTSAVLSRTALDDLLREIDEGTRLRYQETYDLIADLRVTEADFRWSIEQIKELAAERSTAEALTQGMEILTKGRESEKGEVERGHIPARQHVLQSFSLVDRNLAMQDAPEGDMREETDQILEEYAAAKTARLHGHSVGVEFGIPSVDEKINGLQRGELVLLIGYTSDGKSQPLDSKVLTPVGWQLMGNIKVGDEVVDPEGQPSQVVAVYPQGVLPVYRVTFADGSSAEASGDHLWEVEYWKPIKKKQTLVRETWTTERLRVRVASKSKNPSVVSVAGLAGLDFPESPLPIDPYLLGVLLGDGCLVQSTPILTNPESAIAESIEQLLPPGVELVRRQVRNRCTTYSFTSRGQRPRTNLLAVGLRELGLLGHRSWEKFVPEQYKWATAKTRLAILQGLMDTDGGHERGRAIFSSSSRRLRDDVVFLARSLGLKTVVMADKLPQFVYNGEKRFGRVSYRCAVVETEELRVFRLSRKLRKVTSKPKLRKVASVEYVREAECQCIKVSAPSQLYVTDDFLPTHNTSMAVQLAWNSCVNQGKNVVFLTTETLLAQVRRRLVSRHSCDPRFGIDGGLDSRLIKAGELSSSEELQFQAVLKDLHSNSSYGKLYICQVPRAASVAYIDSKLTRLQRQFSVDLVIMDYLALLKSDRRRQTDREELSGIVKEAKQLATTINDGIGVPFVSPWQVSREARKEAEKTGFYTMNALSETAEASNSSDVILSLLAPLDNDSRTTSVRTQVLKHRDGQRANSLNVHLDYATSCFTDEARDDMASLLG